MPDNAGYLNAAFVAVGIIYLGYTLSLLRQARRR